MQKLILIDGNSLINRAFYATPLLTNKDGEPTNAVYAFVNMLVKLISQNKPDYLTVAFDLKAPTFRHGMYADYKGTRKPMPEELRPQIPLLKKVLKTIGINYIEQEGIEADDIIATLATTLKIDTKIVTGDKDSFQLVDDTTSVMFTRRGITDIDLYDKENFKEKTGITPEQVIELKALMGDSSDNIPGVAGVGEKTAHSLLEQFSNIDNLYQNIESVTGKLKQKLIDGKDAAFLSRTLATVKRDCDVDVNLEHMTFKFPFDQKAKELFTKLGFVSLVKRQELFDLSSDGEEIEETLNNGEVSTKAEHKIIKTADELKSLLEGNDKLSLFISKTIGLSAFDNVEYTVQLKEGFFGEGLSYIEALETLKPFVENSKRYFLVFDKKALMHLFDNYEISFNARCDDVSIMKYLADYSGKDDKADVVFDEYGLNQNSPAFNLTYLYGVINKKLGELGMTELYQNVELPLVDVLFSMEKVGMKLDLQLLDKLGEEYNQTLIELEKQIYELAGEKFNINSPKQLGVILFERLGLKMGKKKKSGYSTNADTLEEIEDSHEIVPLIQKYRKVKKLLSTYIDGFRPYIDKNTGIVHTCFNQVITATGRLSSKEPNLQNIPVRDEDGKNIRKLFVARDKEHILVGADYSQIELRLMAHFSGCQKLIDAFNDGKDVHSATAADIFNVPLDKVTSQMRRSAKAVNFGIIYGISDFGLAQNLKIAPSKAGAYIKTYFENYPEVKAYMENLVNFATEKGYAETLFNRKRFIGELKSSAYMVREFGKRVAMNMPLQGSSADIIKVAMINVAKRLSEENLKSKLVLQIHDELIVDALVSETEKVEKILKEEMESVAKLKVKLTVDLERGERLYDAK